MRRVASLECNVRERENCLNGSEGALRKGKNDDAQDSKTQSLLSRISMQPDRSACVLHGWHKD